MDTRQALDAYAAVDPSNGFWEDFTREEAARGAIAALRAVLDLCDEAAPEGEWNEIMDALAPASVREAIRKGLSGRA